MINNRTTYSQYLCKAFVEFWDDPSMTDYPIRTVTYSEVAANIRQLWFAFKMCGLKSGDKVAICGQNSINWGITFLSITTYGTVAVPLLHEFSKEKIINLLRHSDSSIAFISETIWDEIKEGNFDIHEELPLIKAIYSIDDFKTLYSSWENRVYKIGSIKFEDFLPHEFVKNIYHYKREEVVEICYTSGTMSEPKGVMIPSRALASNLALSNAAIISNVEPKNKVLSLLPLSHMYGIMFDFLGSVAFGYNVHFLDKTMSAKNVINALKDIKPCVIILVPLIIETIITNTVLKHLSKKYIKTFYDLFKNKIDYLIGLYIKHCLGNRFYEIIIGGAELNPTVEKALMDYKIPFTVGYGMTECAPLISYSDKCEHVFRSSGKAIPNMEIAIRSGQIFVKGENLMLGYYKDEENTNKSFVDGWFKTGDLGYFDNDYNLYVTGRKDIIIKSDGKNINPLEIEEIINSQNGIDDSIVFFDKIENKLKAIIHLANNDLDIEEIKESINAKLSANEYVSDFIIHAEPFEKTLKGETKRYLYLK